MRFSIFHVYDWVFTIWRRQRFILFNRLLEPGAGHSLLDIGGDPNFWIQHPAILKSIDTLNVYEVPWDHHAFPQHNIRTLVGDGCALQFKDKSYDIAFSNSVIEHVGSWEKQLAFAKEIRRVGKALWVQTPAYECPIEPHYLAPFIHWLPKRMQRGIVRWLTPWGLMQRPSARHVEEMVDTTRLLKRHEMFSLFPDCEICTERLLDLIPKSYIAIRKGD